MIGDILLDRFLRQIHRPPNQWLDPGGRSKCGHCVGATRACLKIFDRTGLAQSPAQDLNIADELIVTSNFNVRDEIGKRSPHQFLLGSAFDWLKARHDPGFGWKGGEKRLGKTMDRLDFQAAWAIEHSGKQLPRPFTHLRIVGLAKMQEIGAKLAIFQSNPACKARADAVRHLCSRGLCEGEAEDGFRTRSLEQKAQYARCQNLRLASAR
jgi:hypothetical protein